MMRGSARAGSESYLRQGMLEMDGINGVPPGRLHCIRRRYGMPCGALGAAPYLWRVRGPAGCGVRYVWNQLRAAPGICCGPAAPIWGRSPGSCRTGAYVVLPPDSGRVPSGRPHMCRNSGHGPPQRAGSLRAGRRYHDLDLWQEPAVFWRAAVVPASSMRGTYHISCPSPYNDAAAGGRPRPCCWRPPRRRFRCMHDLEADRSHTGLGWWRRGTVDIVAGRWADVSR